MSKVLVTSMLYLFYGDNATKIFNKKELTGINIGRMSYVPEKQTDSNVMF
jgi:hypothetical protein